MRVYTYFKKYVQECKSEIILIKVVYFPKLSKTGKYKVFWKNKKQFKMTSLNN